MARVCGYTKVITMPVGSYIDAWLDILQESDMPRPFTAKQAYNWIVNAPPKKEGKRRRRLDYRLARKVILEALGESVQTTLPQE